MPHTVADIAKHVHGEVHGDSTAPITGFAPADSAKRGDLTFAETDAYFAAAEISAASAILIAGDRTSSTKTLIRVKNARVAFAKVLPLFFAEPVLEGQRHPTAVIPNSASVDDTAYIGPHCVIGEHCRIEARAVLLGGNHLGDNCVVGEDTKLFPNVVLYGRTQVGKRVRLHAGWTPTSTVTAEPYSTQSRAIRSRASALTRSRWRCAKYFRATPLPP